MKALDELTTKCIRCGFCLEACPTFVVTGEETESPRGRIYLARSADEGKLAWEAIRPHIDQCLGCRACETACPSGVEYGLIFEVARTMLEDAKPNAVRRSFLSGLTSPGKLRVQLALGQLLPGKKVPRLLSKLLSGEAPEADRPKRETHPAYPPLDEATLPPFKGEVHLLEGCVMRVLFPHVHEATRRLLRRVGYAVRETKQGCCGSLHLHAGVLDEAEYLAGQLCQSLGTDIPLIVDSAGCGSTIKEYGSLIDRPFPKAFDAAEFLFREGLVELLATAPGFPKTVAYHDACHLSHAQGIRSQPRALLAAIPGVTLVELEGGEMCCGSAGIYNVTQPKMARELLERKMDRIMETGAEIVAMGNPGCHAWIAQGARERGGTVRVMHTMEVLEAAFSGVGND